MAYPELRGMNDSLLEGTLDGRVKKIRPDSANSGPDGRLLAEMRKNLSLPYYGVLEPRDAVSPGKLSADQRPDFIPNKGTTEEAGAVFGKTW